MENRETYLVYIDESNILSSTGHSVYTGVYITYSKKDDIAGKVIQIEKDLKILYTHWVDMTWKIRLKFAEKIRNLDFTCQIIVYENPIIQEKSLENFLYEIIKSQEDISRIIVDGNRGRNYERKLKRVLKNRKLKFTKIIFMNDRAEPLIRLADFMAGSYRSFLDHKVKENVYIYNLLKHKIKTPN
jgi:hypothetical protein